MTDAHRNKLMKSRHFIYQNEKFIFVRFVKEESYECLDVTRDECILFAFDSHDSEYTITGPSIYDELESILHDNQ